MVIILRALLAVFFVPITTSAENNKNLDAENLYKKLLELSEVPQEQKSKWVFPRHGLEFSITLLPSLEKNNPSNDSVDALVGVTNREPWYFSYVQAFYQKDTKVNQIAVVTEACNFKIKDNFRETLQNQHTNDVKQVSKEVFGNVLDLEGKYYKELGPHWDKPVRITMRESVAGVTRMKIQRGTHKCDGYSGFALRTDFFLVN